MLLTLIVVITEEQTVYCLPNLFSRKTLKIREKDCFFNGNIITHNEDFLEKKLTLSNSAINHTKTLIAFISVEERG